MRFIDRNGILIPDRRLCYMRNNQGTGAGTSAGTGGHASVRAAAGGGGAPAAPPSGMVGWLKLDDATVGAFPTVANAGSFSGNWTRNGSKVTLASGGPNGMKYAAIDDVTGDDWVHIVTTGTIANLLGTGSYMYGVIFRADTEASSSAQYLGKNLIYDEAGYSLVGLRSAASDKVAPWMWDTAEKAIKLDYTSDTWRALVVRYDADGDTLYAKINGGTWQSLGSVGSFGVTAGVLRLLSRGTGGSDADIAEFLSYTSESEANGDTLMTYLVERAGL